MTARKAAHPWPLNLRLQRINYAAVLMLHVVATPLHGQQAVGTHPSRVSWEEAAPLEGIPSWQQVAGYSGSCEASDAQLQRLQAIVCRSLACSPSCPCRNVTAEGDWPNQVVYMRDLLRTLADTAPPCVNTSVVKETVEWLEGTDTSRSSWWYTWLVFQPQYYDMPRKPGDRIESPATLGRKCWAYAYLRQVWPPLRIALQRAGLGVRAFTKAYEGAVASTMPLCNRVLANCFVNRSYEPTARNGTCPQQARQFYVGYQWENQGGGRNDSARADVAYPFQAYLATEAAAFRADVADTLDTALNFII